MTKKHFIALADALRYTKPKFSEFRGNKSMFTICLVQWMLDRSAIADVCMGNPKFDHQLWLDYIDGKCGPSGEKVK